MVRKVFLITSFLTLSHVCLAQKGLQKITLDKVNSAIRVADIVKEIPSDCKVYSYELSITNSNGLHSVIATSDTIMKYFNGLLPRPQKGNKIFINIAASSCLKNKSKEFKFIIE